MNNQRILTLLKIIAGLYNDFSGAISFNDIPFRNLKLEELRGIIGDNLKENTLFEGTIFENITMGKDDMSMEEIIKICELVDLLSYIQNLPKGIETTILSEGNTLSNSIKLKIILARCIAENPKLMLLEDNFSQLDKDLEKRIKQYLFNTHKGWTIIIASNNEDCLKMMDRIIVLQNGVLVGEGTYDSLCKDPLIKSLLNRNYDEN